MASSRITDSNFNPYDLNSVAEASREIRAGSYLRHDPYVPPRPQEEKTPPAREGREEEPQKSDR
jgi:hypothetical protein